ncbi:MAG: hypothetical protein JSR75_06535 [Proteobacteria bacterium]|nr:hypothetical protein [Pseudomonadota bacterium]
MMFSTTARHACARAAAAWVVLLALAGCGVGVVGTGSGTGDDGNQDIQYTPLGLCTADFADAGLRCSTVSPDPFRGTSTVQWSDADKSRDASVLAVLEGNGLSLQAPCSQLAFLGNWGELPDGTHGFVGRYVSRDAIDGRPAVVHVLAAPAEPTAVGWLEMVDASGATVSGPWLMRRVEGETRFAECAP